MADPKRPTQPIQPVKVEAVAAVPVAVATPPAPATETDLMTQMTAAVKSGDYKSVAKIAMEITKLQKAKEATENEARLKALVALEVDIKAIIITALKPIINSGKLDKADGVWFSYDFGEKLETIRLSKTATKSKSTTGTTGGGGTGKKFAVSTSDLLAKYGAEVYKDNLTFSAAFESNTDKNWRYGIREALLKKDGIIS